MRFAEVTEDKPVDVRGKRVVVMGLGSFSGGVSAARFMANRGARVVVTDLAGPDKLAESIGALADTPVEAMHLGGHREEDFRQADVVVASPAVREDNQLLQIARAHGAWVTTEMNLFFQLCPAPIVGVTGSNGKSTTTALIYSMLQASGRPCWLGGNIGQSLLDRVDDIRISDFVILELSSFQLEDLDELRQSPHAAVVTTFTPNHLDRHPSLESYRLAKQTILRHQSRDDLAILNADDIDVRGWPTRGLTLFYGLDDHGRDGTFFDRDRIVLRRDGHESEFMLLNVLGLPGVHNQSNVAGAVCCAAALGADPVSIRRAVGSFRTLPHRLQLVAEIDGRRFYDDSIATTPESTLAALESLSEPIWLIAGGYDKGMDLTAVARRISERAQGVALIGQTAGTLRRLMSSATQTVCSIRVQECTCMDEAVAWCFSESRRGDVVLLSPACASFGMFLNFVDRANAFRQCVRRLGVPMRIAG
jgi:UDP-N-acetylmuramoylalanine--D-glutamate ligase